MDSKVLSDHGVSVSPSYSGDGEVIQGSVRSHSSLVEGTVKTSVESGPLVVHISPLGQETHSQRRHELKAESSAAGYPQ